MKAYIGLAILAASALALAGCSCSHTEHNEALAAEVEAAMMEGRNAAEAVAATPGEDSLALQRNLLEAKARQSKYIIDNKKEAAAAYDSVFVETLRTKRPDINIGR